MTDKNRPWGVHTIRDIVGSPNCQSGLPDGRYVRAIPEPFTGNRIVAAWWVFTGRAHAVVWPKPGELEDALTHGADPRWMSSVPRPWGRGHHSAPKPSRQG